MSPDQREHVRRLKIRAAALRRHRESKDPMTGKSSLAQSAGRASGKQREGDRAWALEMAIRRWYPETIGDDG